MLVIGYLSLHFFGSIERNHQRPPQPMLCYSEHLKVYTRRCLLISKGIENKELRNKGRVNVSLSYLSLLTVTFRVSMAECASINKQQRQIISVSDIIIHAELVQHTIDVVLAACLHTIMNPSHEGTDM